MAMIRSPIHTRSGKTQREDSLERIKAMIDVDDLQDKEEVDTADMDEQLMQGAKKKQRNPEKDMQNQINLLKDKLQELINLQQHGKRDEAAEAEILPVNLYQGLKLPRGGWLKNPFEDISYTGRTDAQNPI